MTALQDFWQGLTRAARFGLMLGAALILIATIALGFWTLHADYQVLFADLAPQDAATMTTELDKMKTPYRLSGGGNTILVPADVVYKTRLKLVGKELPLRGAVGFELFNDSEVGMTEFAQKVNYQRALQGELTRTILSVEEVQSARVHLVLSEQALFKKNGTLAKASITLATKPGKTLDAAQIQGIQRLVAAAVPDIKANDVTIVDQHGMALTRRNGAEGETRISSDGLDDKRALEAYLSKKVVEVLDRTFGAGLAIATVDVTFSHDNTKVTTENVLGANGDEQSTTGVIVRERNTSRAGTENDAARTTAATPPTGNAGVASREVDYQVGRRVEQVVSAAGAISHVNVAVVVKKALDQDQIDRLKEVVGLAAGVDKERGDAVAVYSVTQMSSASGPASAAPTTTSTTGVIELTDPVMAKLPEPVASEAAPVVDRRFATGTPSPGVLLLCGALALFVLVVLWRAAGRKEAPRPLSAQERDRLLAQVHAWLDSTRATPTQAAQSTQSAERG
jgi:flagellar M-ring protein FliF